MTSTGTAQIAFISEAEVRSLAASSSIGTDPAKLAAALQAAHGVSAVVAGQAAKFMTAHRST